MLETFGLLPLLAVAIVLLWLLFSAIPIVNKYDCLVVFHFGTRPWVRPAVIA